MKKNAYDVLGVDKNASEEDIKKAFKDKAKKAHTDKEGGDHDTMVELNKCYALLSNPAKREQYDSTGETGENLNSFEVRFKDFTQKVFVSGVLEEQKNYEKTDLIEVFRQYVTAIVGQNIDHKNILAAKLDKLKKVQARIVAKKENTIGSLLQLNMDQLTQEINISEDGIQFLNKCQEHLKDFSYTFEKEEPKTYRTYGSISF